MPFRTTVPPYKVVLLGESSVGKTSLIHRFTMNTFNQHTSNTIGAAFITKEYESKTKPDRKIKFEIWDTAGQERYKSLTPMYYRNADLAIVCFDLSNLITLDKAKFWINQIRLNSQQGESGIIIKLVGNKKDLLDNNDIIREVEDFILESGLEFHETSSKSGRGVTELFDKVIDDINDDFFLDFRKSSESRRHSDSNTVNLNILSSESKCC